MSLRTFLVRRMQGSTRAEDRIFAKKGMTSANERYPFIVYKLGNNSSEDLSELSLVSRQFFQVFVHDRAGVELGDYTIIDEVIDDLKQMFHGVGSPADGVISIKYLETSQDLDDLTLGTVMKYVRFQAVTGRADS